MSTAYTANEWAEFVDGFGGDTEEAWEVACFMWDRECRTELDQMRPFCTDSKSAGLLKAAFALLSTDSSIYHEVLERLHDHLWKTNADYRAERASQSPWW